MGCLCLIAGARCYVVGLLVLCLTRKFGLGCEPPYCDNPDFGSCGNACCKLQFVFKGVDTITLKESLNSTIYEGGPDGLYIPAITALGHFCIDDLRPYDKPVHFIGQAYHYSAVSHWQDTVDFTIAPSDDSDDGDSKLFMFSISNIGGAYGDDGQNYNNIMQLVSSLGLPYSMKHLDESCSAAAAASSSSSSDLITPS